MAGTVQPTASHIWDEAEVYVIAKNAVDDIEALVPATLAEELDAQWLSGFVGLLDASAGIPITPELEITHYDAFGHARYRSKAKKGTITTGFTAFEDNAVTKQFVLPGSRAGKVGAPKTLHFYTCYVTRDEDIATRILISSEPALLELSSHSGMVEGEQESYEMTVHHANDADRDVFFSVDNSTTGAVADDLVLTTSALPPGVVGAPYTQTLAATGGTGAKVWSKTGTLPAGLTLSTAGVLSGTPTAASTGSVTFTVTDSATPTPDTASKAITVTVTAS
ncbi:Ig domain-containing protein [Rhodococcus sp. MALMAid1271]|uniref:Ig domain-containing protein n=1 Tax=Rhodococcus sp. MALMAid1271 TaxID=3411744 RepID=UPI003BA2DE9C